MCGGLTLNSAWMQTEAARDGRGFLVTNATLATSVRDIFAAGDVRRGNTKRVASAAGEGTTAALMIREYLRGM